MSHGRFKFDLMIVDISKGLLILNVSSTLEHIPDWNKHDTSHIKTLFEFSYFFYLDNNVCMLLIIPKTNVGTSKFNKSGLETKPELE